MTRDEEAFTPQSRAKARSRLRTLTRGAVLAATGATAVIGVVVAHDHSGASTSLRTGSDSSTSSSGGATSSSSTGTSASTGNTGTSGSTGNTGNLGTSSSTPSRSSSTPNVVSGGTSA